MLTYKYLLAFDFSTWGEDCIWLILKAYQKKFLLKPKIFSISFDDKNLPEFYKLIMKIFGPHIKRYANFKSYNFTSYDLRGTIYLTING